MNEKPLVSVAIPCYNHAQFIQETIQSVIEQDYENIELIIIDDGSKDNSVEKIKEIVQVCEARFKRFEFRCRPNEGLSATLNEAIDWAKGKYFSGCASDDIFLKSKVSLLVNSLEGLDGQYVAVFGDAVFVDCNGNTVFLDKKNNKLSTVKNGTCFFLEYFSGRRGVDYKDPRIFGSYSSLIAGNYLPAMSNIVRLDKIKEVGGWTAGNTIEDWEMWLKLSKKYKIYCIDQPVAKYRWHDSNTHKTMKYELTRDAIHLLIAERDFAFAAGHKEGLYRSLSSFLVNLIVLDCALFFRAFLKLSKDVFFVYIFIKVFFSKFAKLIQMRLIF